METSPPTSPANRKPLLKCVAALTLGGFCFFVYEPALKGGFIWDDADIYIVENRPLRDPDALRKFWLTTEPEDYYPLTYTTFWLEYRVFGLSPLGYHVDNLVLHVVVSLLAWRTASKLGVAHPWMAALLFAVHPVCVEAVAWISQRKTLLATLFGLLTASAFLKSMDSPRKRPSFAAAIWFFGSLASKPSLIGLPILFFAYAWRVRGESIGCAFRRVAPLVLLAIGFGVVGLWFQQHRVIGDAVVREQNAIERASTGAVAAWFYLAKALWPAEVCFIYPRWELSSLGVRAWLAMLAWPAALGLAFAFDRRRTFTALSAFLVLLAPVLGLVDVYFWRYSYVADHYQYAALIATTGWLTSFRFSNELRKTAYLVGLLAIVVWWTIVARRAAATYQSEEAIWRDVLRKNPSAWICHGNLVRILFSQGRSTEAIEHYEELKRLTLAETEALLTAAADAVNRGDADSAERLARRVIKLDPLNRAANRHLAFLLAERGDWLGALDRAHRVRDPDAALLDLVGKANESLKNTPTTR